MDGAGGTDGHIPVRKGTFALQTERPDGSIVFGKVELLSVLVQCRDRNLNGVRIRTHPLIDETDVEAVIAVRIGADRMGHGIGNPIRMPSGGSCTPAELQVPVLIDAAPIFSGFFRPGAIHIPFPGYALIRPAVGGVLHLEIFDLPVVQIALDRIDLRPVLGDIHRPFFRNCGISFAVQHGMDADRWNAAVGCSKSRKSRRRE